MELACSFGDVFMQRGRSMQMLAGAIFYCQGQKMHHSARVLNAVELDILHMPCN